MGATDPTSGTVSLHEIVRGFSALIKTGWKPLRTSALFQHRYYMLVIYCSAVILASWDAEEVTVTALFPGLLITPL
jgi:N-acetylated-alpha-linked acidic dipeptidase